MQTPRHPQYSYVPAYPQQYISPEWQQHQHHLPAHMQPQPQQPHLVPPNQQSNLPPSQQQQQQPNQPSGIPPPPSPSSSSSPPASPPNNPSQAKGTLPRTANVDACGIDV